MQGLMQHHELLISTLIRHARANHGTREIVSRRADGGLDRSTYAEVEARSRRLAAALIARGIVAGDRIATLACSNLRHLECFYGVSGLGAVLHTVNPRLYGEQIAYIVNHAEDRALLFDADQLATVEALAPKLRSIERWVVLADRAGMPTSSTLALECYEDWLAGARDDYAWPSFDERAASSLCYTSGTTGNPKGVLYSHRSTLLHAYSASMPDGFGLRATDAVMPIAPLFHANGWSIPYCAAMMGCKIVLPGNRLDAASLHELIAGEGVSFAVGVPTIWTMLIAHLRQTKQSMPTLERVIVAGTALPAVVQQTLREEFGVRAIHAWGMTETSPIGTFSTPSAEVAALPDDERAVQLLKQGRTPWGVEMRIVDAAGATVPKDGTSFGALWVRGPWIASGYFKGDGGNVLDADGWFPTGDVATWDRYGYMQITDRTKDVIKSGGEWISSIELENLAMAHPKVRLAAAVAAHHPKWDERPVLVVVPAAGEAPTREELLEYLKPRIAKWWLPDDVVFVAELPMTGTGKILKSTLRERYWDHLAGRGAGG